MRERAGLTKDDAQKSHDETLPTAMKRDEEHVTKLITQLKENMTNPFDVDSHPDVLINISTGVHAAPEVQESLLSAVDTGQRQLEQFVKSTLSTDETRSFYSPISKSGIKTFADMSKKARYDLKVAKE